DLNLSFDEFPAEGGQEDSTLAHAVERLYAIVCEISGHDWVKVARPDLMKNRSGVVVVKKSQDLTDFLSHKLVSLTPAVRGLKVESDEAAEVPVMAHGFQLR